MTDLLSWSINIIAVVGWLMNVKYRLYAMLVFTTSTLLSMIYFYVTDQIPFLVCSILYLIIDLATILHCLKEDK